MASSRDGIESPSTTEPGGFVARFRQRLFPAAALALPGPGPASLPSPEKRRMSFNAGIAEFLLINRLKARGAHKFQAAEMLERAARIVFITCKNWFSAPDGKNPQSRTPL